MPGIVLENLNKMDHLYLHRIYILVQERQGIEIKNTIKISAMKKINRAMSS